MTYLQQTDATLTTCIRGTGSVIKTGAGVLTFGAATAYSGATTINAGTLQLAASAPNAGLVCRYTMDGPLGTIANGTTMVDLGFSPNANNGTMVGTGQAMSLDSSARASNRMAATSRPEQPQHQWPPAWTDSRLDQRQQLLRR